MAWLPYDADAYKGEYDKNLFGARFYADYANATKADRPADQGISVMITSDDGKRLFVASQEGFLEMWEVQGFKMLAHIRANKGLVYSISPNSAGDLVATASRDGFVRLYQVRPDPNFNIKPDSLQYQFAEVQNAPIPEVHLVELLDNDTILAGTSDGKIVVVSGPRDVPTPPAVPVVTPQSNDDHDY